MWHFIICEHLQLKTAEVPCPSFHRQASIMKCCHLLFLFRIYILFPNSWNEYFFALTCTCTLTKTFLHILYLQTCLNGKTAMVCGPKASLACPKFTGYSHISSYILESEVTKLTYKSHKSIYAYWCCTWKTLHVAFIPASGVDVCKESTSDIPGPESDMWKTASHTMSSDLCLWTDIQ